MHITLTLDHHARAKECARRLGKSSKDWLRDAVLFKIEFDEAKFREEIARKRESEAAKPKRRGAVQKLPPLPDLPPISPVVEPLYREARAAAASALASPKLPTDPFERYYQQVSARLSALRRVPEAAAVAAAGTPAAPGAATTTTPGDLGRLATWISAGGDAAETKERLDVARAILTESSETAEEAARAMREIERLARGSG